jgi:hypothetical protein
MCSVLGCTEDTNRVYRFMGFRVPVISIGTGFQARANTTQKTHTATNTHSTKCCTQSEDARDVWPLQSRGGDRIGGTARSLSSPVCCSVVVCTIVLALHVFNLWPVLVGSSSFRWAF